MSDVSIPGVKSKYGTQQIIEDLMKVEKIPKTRAEESLKKLEESKKIWQDLNVRMSKLRDTSRTLYSFKNPFSERIGNSSNVEALTASATREALEQTKTITIKQKAEADRFLSNPLSKDFKVPEGLYSFTVADKNIQIQFSGGSLKEFSDAVNKKGKDIISTSVIQTTKDSQSLAFESKISGSKNRLSFSNSALDLALKTGMISKTDSSERKLNLDIKNLSNFESTINVKNLSAENGTVKLKTNGEFSIQVNPEIKNQNDFIIEYKIKVTKLGDDETTEPSPPSGPVLPDAGKIVYEDIEVLNAAADIQLPEWKKPDKPIVVEDMQIAYAKSNNKVIKLNTSVDSSEFITIQVPLSELGGSLEALSFKNRNTNREVEIKDVRLYNPKAVSGYVPTNPIASAQDAVIVMDGITITREKNTIDDVIPGVTMNILDVPEKNVKLKIEPDRKTAKETIIKFVGEYNRLMAELNILSRNDDKVISELDYFTEDETKKAKEHLGLMQGDFTISQFKNTLQRVMTNGYATSKGKELSLLSQIGVTTDSRQSGAGFDASKLRGYLEIDEGALDKALAGEIPPISQLFGFDSDGDLLVDTGAAFSMDTLIKPYTETGGLISVKTGTIDTQITSQKKQIETLDKQLIAKEADLKRKYGMMESSLNQMEQTSNSITNFSKNSGQ